ncbi:MAG: hypothetical protein OXG15_03390 [Gammaproteobacteria bacterium]|nr:hypothetical protein [Gammaproteobacteria bacterium]
MRHFEPSFAGVVKPRLKGVDHALELGEERCYPDRIVEGLR